MKNILCILLSILLSVFRFTAAAQYTLDTTATINQVAQSLAGVNVIIGNATYTGSPLSVGLFTDSSNNYYFHQGIILSSGSVNLPAFNTSGNLTTQIGTIGDSALSAISGHITYDAASLEFDFQGISDTATFHYVFASDEYPEWAGSQFNDVFALFISGPGINGVQNVALLPDTLLPVSINTVNNGPLNTGPCNSCAYYDDHKTVPGPFVYDGSTKILTAKMPLVALGLYHLKLVIADVSDRIWDSAILIEGSSVAAAAGLRQYINAIPSTSASICQGDSILLTATQSISYLWNTGDTLQSIYAKQSGNYYYSISDGDTTVTSALFTLVYDTSSITCNPLTIDEPTTNLTQAKVFVNSTNALSFEFNSKLNEAVLAKVYDVNGRLLITQSYSASIGNNKFIIATESLPKGLYLLEAVQNKSMLKKKFMLE